MPRPRPRSCSSAGPRCSSRRDPVRQLAGRWEWAARRTTAPTCHDADLTKGAVMATALITGASSGIGMEIARILARDHDVIVAARSADVLDQLTSELGGNA